MLYAAIAAKPTAAIERATTFSIFSPVSKRQYVERVYKSCHEKGLVIRPFTLKCVRYEHDVNFHALRNRKILNAFG